MAFGVMRLPDSVVFRIVDVLTSKELTSTLKWYHVSEETILAKAFNFDYYTFRIDDYEVMIDAWLTQRTGYERRYGIDLLVTMSFKDRRSGAGLTKFFIAQAKKCRCKRLKPILCMCCILIPLIMLEPERPCLIDFCDGNLRDEAKEQLKKMLRVTRQNSYLLILTKDHGFYYVRAIDLVNVLGLSCEKVSGKAICSPLFYSIFARCLVGEALVNKYIKGAIEALNYYIKYMGERAELGEEDLMPKLHVHLAVEGELRWREWGP
ncbi:MAG: hypothetical protein DRJ67_08480 [Thermoprotei archaeon]|nr:MAG: hypothetical protein DRJ67_08480 [Thermoprotei archaeon]